MYLGEYTKFPGSYYLVGGFKTFLNFTPGNMIQFEEHIFLKWAVEPPTRAQ